jgi:hypothetical protein
MQSDPAGRALQVAPFWRPRMTVSLPGEAVLPLAVNRLRRAVLVPLYWLGSFS